MFDRLLIDHADQLALFEEVSFVESSEIEGGVLVTLDSFDHGTGSGNATNEFVDLNERHFVTLDQRLLSALNLGQG